MSLSPNLKRKQLGFLQKPYRALRSREELPLLTFGEQPDVHPIYTVSLFIVKLVSVFLLCRVIAPNDKSGSPKPKSSHINNNVNSTMQNDIISINHEQGSR